MNRIFVRVVCIVLCLSMAVGFAGCTQETDEMVKKALNAIAENEQIQQWLSEHDLSTLSEEAITKFKNSIPVLKEFLAREDVQEKFRTVALPMIKEFLSYGLESMRLKAETLANIVRIFAPELTSAVDAIFETAPEVTEPTGTSEIPETTLAPSEG